MYSRFVAALKSQYPERSSALDFKDTAAPQFGQSDVASCLLYTKSNYFGQVIPKKLKKF